MTRLLSIQTDHEDMAAAAEALAPRVSESSLRVASGVSAEDGDWVKFRWLLRDGTTFWEGVGRCASCRAAGRERFEVVLDNLSFDARNEVMFERMLLALDRGRQTGEMPAVAKTVEKAPAPRSLPSKSPSPARHATRGPRYSSIPPAPKRAAAPPAPPPAKLSSVVKAALRPKPTSSPSLRPVAKLSTTRVPPDLAERARVLSRQLNLAAPSLARGRWTEDRVLEAALRMGIESLEGLIKARDSGG